MNYQDILKKQTSIILISVIFMVLIIIGVSYSLFMQVDESKDIQVLESGTLVLSSTKGNTITTSTVPQSDYDGMNTEGYTFSIKNNGTLDCNYVLYISNVASNPLDEKYIRISINNGAPISIVDLTLDQENTTRYTFKKGTLKAANQGNDVITYNIKVWIDELAPASIIGKKIQLQIDLFGEGIIVEEVEPAEPELYAGLIPVTYDDNNTILIADTNTEWYNYSEHEWANAILIDQSNSTIKNKYINGDGSLKSGATVDIADVSQMYVWIPRYKYRMSVVNCGDIVSPNQGEHPYCYVANLTDEEQNNLANWLFTTSTYETLEEAKTAVSESINNGTFNIMGMQISQLEAIKVFNEAEENADKQITTGSNFKSEVSYGVAGSFDCIFENKTTSKSNGNAVNEYLTHPAFTFGSAELNGLWVGKFETSGTTDNLKIIPNFLSLRDINVSTMFNASRAIESNSKFTLSTSQVDTHMMKNMEWGAVAYLTNSKYGRYYQDGSCISSGCEVWINNNSNYTTGCAGDSVSASESASCNAWNTSTGVNASTTGTIYGIYDMSGGSFEYVMGNMVDSSGAFYLSSSGFTSVPDSKYYDSYLYGEDMLDYSRGHLGDATKEVALWSGDFASFVSLLSPWFIRGGDKSGGNAAGVFGFYFLDGGKDFTFLSFRVVIAAE